MQISETYYQMERVEFLYTHTATPEIRYFANEFRELVP
jgi:hypothetical protein